MAAQPISIDQRTVAGVGGSERRRQLGDFLRSRREGLDPTIHGRDDGRRRRTPGLRREEVAERAGIGIDWYIRLEQGRDVNPSRMTLDALAKALDLTETEHHHLWLLARPAVHDHFVREQVPHALRAMVTALDQPAYVIGRRFDVLAWNAAAVDLFTDYSLIDERDRNIVTIMLTDPEAKRVFGPSWSSEAQRILALFRSVHDLYENDPAFIELVRELDQRSPTFRQWWRRHDVRSTASGTKTIHSLREAPHKWRHQSFLYHDNPNLRLVIYTPDCN
jgi:transcriptional regulator with XRE-family HTH domain